MSGRVNSPWRVPGRGKWSLADTPTRLADESLDRKALKKKLKGEVKKICALQEQLYAHDHFSLLCVFQAMDAAGKDSTIRAVFTGVNPAGFQVSSFKKPSANELDQDFLWRSARALPQRGRIGVFNRSYYEECLVVRVHPQILQAQRLPPDSLDDGIWGRRLSVRTGMRTWPLTRTPCARRQPGLHPGMRSRRTTNRACGMRWRRSFASTSKPCHSPGRRFRPIRGRRFGTTPSNCAQAASDAWRTAPRRSSVDRAGPRRCPYRLENWIDCRPDTAPQRKALGGLFEQHAQPWRQSPRVPQTLPASAGWRPCLTRACQGRLRHWRRGARRAVCSGLR